MKKILKIILETKWSAMSLNTIVHNYRQKKLIINESKLVRAQIKEWVGNHNQLCISLGQNCNTAWYLKETENKKSSYPFDWIFSSAEIIEHSIHDSFLTFLDKDLFFEKDNGSKAGHLFYHSSLFNHRNPLKSNDDYEYYVRCVERFLLELNKEQKIVFVITVINESEKRPGWSKGFDREFDRPMNQTLSTFDNLRRLICSIHSNSKFLFLEQYTEANLDLRMSFKDETALWVSFSSIGKNSGVKYLNKFDDGVMKNIYLGLKIDDYGSFAD